MDSISLGKNLLRPEQTFGEKVELKATDSRHFNINSQNAERTGNKNFSNLLLDSLNKVNSYQNNAADLSVKAMYSPGEVEAHQVTMALAKANMSVALAKSVIDKGIQAYKEIINIR